MEHFKTLQWRTSTWPLALNGFCRHYRKKAIVNASSVPRFSTVKRPTNAQSAAARL
jgi:hypothetical protein